MELVFSCQAPRTWPSTEEVLSKNVLLLLVAALWPTIPCTYWEKAGGELWGQSDFCSTWNAKLGLGMKMCVRSLKGVRFQSPNQQHCVNRSKK